MPREPVPAYFPNLDVLRAIAVAAVFGFHFVSYNQIVLPEKPLSFLVLQGWLGANLFFVISGFVIALSCFRSFEREPKDHLVGFLTKRAARILPLHYLTCTVYAIAYVPALFTSVKGLLTLVGYAIFAYTFWFPISGLVNGQNWSISIEVQFYIVLALATPLLRRVPVLPLLVACIVLSTGWDLFWLARISSDDPQRIYRLFFVTSQLPGLIDTFALGLVLARIALDPGKRPIWDWASRYWPVLFAGAFACLAFAFVLYARVPPLYDGWRIWFTASTLVGHHLSTSLGFFLLIFACAGSGTARTDWWLAPLRYLGVVSYGFYLWHGIVLLALKNFPELAVAPRLVLAAGLTIGLSALSWHLFEQPILRRFGSNAIHTGLDSNVKAIESPVPAAGPRPSKARLPRADSSRM